MREGGGCSLRCMFDARGALPAGRLVTRFVVFVAVGDLGFVLLAVVGELGPVMGLDVVSPSCA